MSKKDLQPIIVKKVKKAGHGHHGGAWKVAFADFTTAMMAFFMLMWLLGSTTKEQQKYISGYFNDPTGASIIGSGGAAPGIIHMEQPMREPPAQGTIPDQGFQRPGQQDTDGMSDDEATPETEAAQLRQNEMELLRKAESEKLEALEKQLQKAVSSEEIFEQLKDQVLIDTVPSGLRIQIIDKENRASFDSGSANIKDYTEAVLEALGPLLDKVPNKISITGHTDATPYAPDATYTNWELSADRANTARRGLIAGGYPSEKIAKVEGFADSQPFAPEYPLDPINRRIAIIVLKQEVLDTLNQNIGIDSSELMPAE
jgi:chemotaxis protein MotB